MERFWSKVDKSDNCWEWMASRNEHGYGKFAKSGSWVFAHRFAFELLVGPIPDGKCVCHKCDNPACVNPEHLFLGSHAENMRDMAQKGRAISRPGERNPRAILDEDAVRLIRQSELSSRELGSVFGVKPVTIYKARRGENWKSV